MSKSEWEKEPILQEKQKETDKTHVFFLDSGVLTDVTIQGTNELSIKLTRARPDTKPHEIAFAEALVSLTYKDNGLASYELQAESNVDVDDLPIFQKVLRLSSISSNGFEWQDVEIEHTYVEKKEIRKNTGFATYGSTIYLQDCAFTIIKNDDHIIVACLALKEHRLWFGLFPINLSTSGIIAIANDRGADFRDIKYLISGVRLALGDKITF